MKIVKNETMATLIALFLMLTITATLITVLPIVNAQPTPYKTFYMFNSAAPNPVGVGQPVLIVAWSDDMPPDIGETAGFAGRAAWHNYEITITKPDGATQKIVIAATDPVGSTYASFTPDQVGTYSFQTYFPGEWKNSTTFQRYFPPATSEKATFTVQQEPLSPLPGAALPTDYWTRPINAYNREWSRIAGNWLGPRYNQTSSFNPYTTGPETAHIVWTKPITFGGIAGGTFDDISYATGSAYEQKFLPPIILNGVLYYNEFPVRRGTYTSTPQGYLAVNLRTGEQLWWQNSSTSAILPSDYAGLGQSYGGLSFGQLYEYESPNQHGVLPYLWVTSGSTWEMHDAFTGRHWLRITNVPSGTQMEGTDGSILIYTTGGVGTNRWFALWNASRVIQTPTQTGTGSWQWRPPYGATLNGTTAGYGGPYSWNVTVTTVAGTSITYVGSDILIASATLPNVICRYGISLKSGEEGRLLWSQNYTRPSNDQIMNMGGDMGDGVFFAWNKETRQLYGYDAYTGLQLWGPTESLPVWDMYGLMSQIAYGKLYIAGWSGTIHAYDLKTGKQLWNSSSDACGLNGPYPNWPFRGSLVVADGKIYVSTDEHSHTQPLYKGWKMYSFDAETGKSIWNITGLYAYTQLAIADGYLIGQDSMDNRIYSFGKGQTATTVSAPQTIPSLGSSVMITGTVTDQSPGAKGTPAIADDDMTAWMEYLYHQRQMPKNAKGVEVTLDTIDPNGNFVHIGNTTSDMSGLYSYVFTPDIPGKYTVIATFAGSKSYYSSYAETAMGVSEAAPTASPYPAITLPPTEMYFAASTAAIIIAIVIVGMLLLRKKP